MHGNSGGDRLKGQPFSLHFARSVVLWQHTFLKLSQDVQTPQGLLEEIASSSYRQKHFVAGRLCCIVCMVICIIDVVT